MLFCVDLFEARVALYFPSFSRTRPVSMVPEKLLVLGHLPDPRLFEKPAMAGSRMPRAEIRKCGKERLRWWVW